MPTTESMERAKKWAENHGEDWFAAEVFSLAALLDEVREGSLKEHREALSKAHDKIQADYDKGLEAERQRCVQAVQKVRKANTGDNADMEWSGAAETVLDEFLRELGLDDQGEAPEPQAETHHMWCPYCGRVYVASGVGVFMCGPHETDDPDAKGCTRMRELSPDEQATRAPATNPSARSALLVGCLVNGEPFYI